jgi:hypothetical protein
MISCCHLNRLPLRRPYSLRNFAANKSCHPGRRTAGHPSREDRGKWHRTRLGRSGTDGGSAVDASLRPRQVVPGMQCRRRGGAMIMLHPITSAAAHAPGMLAP